MLKKRSNFHRSRPALTKTVQSQTEKLLDMEENEEQKVVNNSLNSQSRYEKEELKIEVKRLNEDLKLAKDLILKFQRDENSLNEKYQAFFLKFFLICDFKTCFSLKDLRKKI